ncbi:MAG: cytochrome c-type biogenesis protein CcmH [Alphaproteobacteria bacterium]|nr:cytochrome c-type biogenesis protein CcmH [Alphaproteobacteria bacterium]
MRSFALFFALLCLSSLPAWTQARAIEPGEALNDPILETRARALSAELRCPVCQNQSIDDSDAPLARDLRLLLRRRLLAGDSDDEIRHFIVARYGEFVLLKPPISPKTWLLWAAPALILLFICVIGWRIFKKNPLNSNKNP